MMAQDLKLSFLFFSLYTGVELAGSKPLLWVSSFASFFSPSVPRGAQKNEKKGFWHSHVHLRPSLIFNIKYSLEALLLCRMRAQLARNYDVKLWRGICWRSQSNELEVSWTGRRLAWWMERAWCWFSHKSPRLSFVSQCLPDSVETSGKCIVSCC